MPESAPSRVITIDGPAGVGKTTLARRLAAHTGLAYLDTGAMFRATALHLGDQVAELDAAGLRRVLDGLVFSLEGGGAHTRLLLNGREVGDEVRGEEVGMMASRVAVIPAVRAFQKAEQQRLGAAASLVAEGRDMGTVVFPHAAVKFFLDASPEVRARRRQGQLLGMGRPAPDLADLAARIAARDEQDRNRAEAPLRPAEDAVVIDTSDLDIDAVFERMAQACP